MASLTRTISLQPASGTSFVNISTTPATGTNTIKSDFPSLATGMQVEWDNTSGISISSNGTVTRTGTGTVTFNYRVWQGEGTGWSAADSFTFEGLSLTGQVITSAQGVPYVNVGGTVVLLGGQQIAAAQGSFTYKLDMRFSISGQALVASYGTLSVGTGDAITIALVGQQITIGQEPLSLKYGNSNLVALHGQATELAIGTLDYYSSIVKVALNGQPLGASQGDIIKVIQGLVPTVWTPEAEDSSVWTAAAEAALNWTPESGSVNTWKKEGL